ncbi:MAG: hscA, partial [Bacteriovoracaceae bacterium]|nr:hscA [Bacteriovoracaceae bacterium]
MSSKPLIIGIDLGTTNSLVSICDEKGARILQDGDSTLIPSVIYFDEQGKIQAVGNRAKTLKSIDPSRIIYSIKRLLGRGRADLPKLTEELPFDFSESTDEMIKIKMGSRSYTPIDLSAEILKRCKFVAENHLGVPIRKAVVTVPAYFNDAQRSATALAGKLAGLDIVRIINEPTAAALAFGIGKTKDQRIVAVYDFGGGTFDISILKVTGGMFEVLSTAGDTRLGGDDIDQAFFEFIFKKIGKRPESKEDEVLLRAQLERIKISLSGEESIQSTLQWANEIQWQGPITRVELETLMTPIVQKTIRCCEEATQSSGVNLSEITDVVLVGGSSRIPFVRAAVKNYFKREPNASMNPDEVVALGAAIQASILSGEIEDTLLLDIVPLSLGLETMGGIVSKIILRNSTIPLSVSEMFTTYADSQTAVDFHIVQGEREFAKDCRSLGRFKLKIPPAPAGIPKIRVTFLMDANGLLRVSAVDDKTLAVASLDVKPTFGLNDHEVERMLQEAWGNAETDFRMRMLTEARN